MALIVESRIFVWFLCISAIVIDICECNNCQWGDLDLSPLMDEPPIQCDYAWALQYTACGNFLECEGLEGMMIQYAGSGACVIPTATWDNGHIKPKKIENKTSGYIEYSFFYPNGVGGSGCDKGRNSTITFICDEDAKPYDFENIDCREYHCHYFLTIRTYLACHSGGGGGGGDGSNSDANDGGISIGTLCLIGFVSVIVLYCTIGYFVKYFKNRDAINGGHGKQNIPNVSFWFVLPLLTKNGCIVSYEWIMAKSGKNTNNNNEADEDLVDRDAQDLVL